MKYKKYSHSHPYTCLGATPLASQRLESHRALCELHLTFEGSVLQRHASGWECQYFFIFHILLSKQSFVQNFSQFQ